MLNPVASSSDDDEVAGLVLQSLYPGHLRFAEALAALRLPKSDKGYGPYVKFWSDGIWDTTTLLASKRKQLLQALASLFGNHRVTRGGTRTFADDGARKVAIALNKVFARFLDAVAQEIDAGVTDIEMVSSWLRIAHDWGAEFGLVRTSALSDALKRNDAFKSQYLRWCITQMPKGSSANFLSSVPFYLEAIAPGDADMFYDIALEYSAEARIAVPAFVEAAHGMFQRGVPADIENLVELSTKSPELSATHGLYVVAWAGLGKEKSSPSGFKPASAVEMRAELAKVADDASRGKGKTVSVHVVDVSVPPLMPAAPNAPRKKRTPAPAKSS